VKDVIGKQSQRPAVIGIAALQPATLGRKQAIFNGRFKGFFGVDGHSLMGLAIKKADKYLSAY
jgi:hypothetical protein